MTWTAYGAGGDGYGAQAFAPQGAIGNVIGSAAPAVGTALGTVFGLRDVVNPHLVTVMAVVGVVNGVFAVPALRAQRWALLARQTV